MNHQLSVNGDPVDPALLEDCQTVGDALARIQDEWGLSSPKMVHKKKALAPSAALPSTGKLFVIGPRVEAVEMQAQEEEELARRREEVAKKRERIRKEAKRKAPRQRPSPYCFQSFKTLPGFSDAHLARDFLKRLAADRGIAGVMKKHRWTVPALSEMY